MFGVKLMSMEKNKVREIIVIGFDAQKDRVKERQREGGREEGREREKERGMGGVERKKERNLKGR